MVPAGNDQITYNVNNMTRNDIILALKEFIPPDARWPLSGYPFTPTVDSYNDASKRVTIDMGMSRFVEISAYDRIITKELQQRFPDLKVDLIHREDW